jgi:WD repeat-containing protein 81
VCFKDGLSISTDFSNNADVDDPNDSTVSNLSTTAKNTFQKLIVQLGPVLTCKYFCNDLLKMLTICYMNRKLLNPNETDNPLDSLKPVLGDKYAINLLESLKHVVYLYGEQIILLQYFTYVTNAVQTCSLNLANSQRLTVRLEASLISACVLINFFCSYLDLKLSTDNLSLILNQVLLPVLELVSNFNLKFPNSHRSRNLIGFKLLDIILLLSLRLGRDQTKLDLENVLIRFFDLFTVGVWFVLQVHP